MKLTVIVEKSASNWGAYTPDDIGSVLATGATREETLENFRAALRSHLAALRASGQSIPDIETLEVQELVTLGTVSA